MTQTIDITPTPEGIANMRKAIEESIERHNTDLLKLHEIRYSHADQRKMVLVDEGLELVEMRIEKDLEGLYEALKELTPHVPLTPRQRLEMLSKFLRTVPEEQFDMNNWGYNKEEEGELFTCGFAGCAAGWGASIPELRKDGLSLVRMPESTYADVFFTTPDGKVLDSFDALEEFFDIDHDTCLSIFSGIDYVDPDGRRLDVSKVTPAMVSDKIDNYLAKYA